MKTLKPECRIVWCVLRTRLNIKDERQWLLDLERAYTWCHAYLALVAACDTAGCIPTLKSPENEVTERTRFLLFEAAQKCGLSLLQIIGLYQSRRSLLRLGIVSYHIDFSVLQQVSS